MNHKFYIQYRPTSARRILYLTNDTIIAMVPDIPINHQRVQLSAKGSAQIACAMDGNDIGRGTGIGWC